MDGKQFEVICKIGTIFEDYELSPSEAKEIVVLATNMYKLHYTLKKTDLLEAFVEELEKE